MPSCQPPVQVLQSSARGTAIILLTQPSLPLPESVIGHDTHLQGLCHWCGLGVPAHKAQVRTQGLGQGTVLFSCLRTQLRAPEVITNWDTHEISGDKLCPVGESSDLGADWWQVPHVLPNGNYYVKLIAIIINNFKIHSLIFKMSHREEATHNLEELVWTTFRFVTFPKKELPIVQPIIGCDLQPHSSAEQLSQRDLQWYPEQWQMILKPHLLKMHLQPNSFVWQGISGPSCKAMPRKGIGWAFKENAAGACWSHVLPGLNDTKGQKMGWERCPLSGQTWVLWHHENYSHSLPPLWPSSSAS